MANIILDKDELELIKAILPGTDSASIYFDGTSAYVMSVFGQSYVKFPKTSEIFSVGNLDISRYDIVPPLEFILTGSDKVKICWSDYDGTRERYLSKGTFTIKALPDLSTLPVGNVSRLEQILKEKGVDTSKHMGKALMLLRDSTQIRYALADDQLCVKFTYKTKPCEIRMFIS